MNDRPQPHRTSKSPLDPLSALLLPAWRRTALAVAVLSVTWTSAVALETSTHGKGVVTELPLGTSPSNESVDQFGSSVAPLASGGFGALWTFGLAPTVELRMQWTDATGSTVFPAGGQLVANNLPGPSGTIAADPKGGAFVAFSDATESIVVQSFDSTGGPRWPGAGVTASSFAGKEPMLVADSLGGVYACFSALQQGGIRCQHFDSQGARLWTTDGIVAGGSGSTSVLPKGVADGAGGLLVFWLNFGDPLNETVDPIRIEGQRLGPPGSPIWNTNGLVIRTTNLLETPVNQYSGEGLAVVSDSAGGAVVTFNDWLDQTASNLDVASQRVAADGSLLWGSVAAVIAGSTHHQHVITAPAPGGGAFVIADEEVSANRNRLRIFRLDGSGQHLWNAAGIELSDPSATGLNYSARGSFDHGLLRIAWAHQVFPLTLEIDVRFARFRPDGTRLDPPAGQAVSETPDLQVCFGMAYSPVSGKTFVLWDDRRSADWDNLDVYAAELAAQNFIFADGFESGDTSAWSQESP